jgi:hypothetical protein
MKAAEGGDFMTNLERFAWVISGFIVGAIIVGLWQPDRATAQTATGVWQFGASPVGAGAWRLNTLTGEMDFCFFAQGRCVQMGR